MTLTPESLKALREKAEPLPHSILPHEVTLRSTVMLALLDRIEALEKDKAEALAGLVEAHAAMDRVDSGLKRLRELSPDDRDAQRNGGGR